MTADQGKDRRRPKGSVGSHGQSPRAATRRRAAKKGESDGKIVSSRRGLGPTRDERARESRALQLVMWLSVIFFLILSGGLFAFQAFAFLAGDKPDTEVPDITGTNIEEASELVDNAGLVLRVRSESFSDDVEKDLIIEQVPGAGAHVKEGRDVLVDVSLGSRNLVTPNVIGLERTEAEQVLNDVGVRPNWHNQYSDIAAPGTVINQSPPAGDPIALGETVNVVVSAGPLDRAQDMPDLTGLTYEEALEVVKEYNLSLRRVTRTYVPQVNEETVQDQYPLPGTQVRTGSEVVLTLKAPTSYQRLGHRSTRIIVTVPESEGTVQVSITVQDRYETKEVYNQEHTGPATIEQLISSYGRTTVWVNFNNRNIREEIF